MPVIGCMRVLFDQLGQVVGCTGMHEIQCCTEPKVYDSLQAPASQTCAGPRFVQRSLGTGLAPKGDVGATNLQEKLLQQISVTEGCTDDGTYRVLGKEPVGESFAPPERLHYQEVVQPAPLWVSVRVSCADLRVSGSSLTHCLLQQSEL
jgi:hypothetical protein